MRYWFTLILFSSMLYYSQNTVTSYFKEKSESSSQIMAIYDVRLEKTTIAGSPIKYGVSVPFNLVVHNDGDMPIANVDVIDYVPPGFTFDNANPNGWVPHPTVANGYTTTVAGPIAPGSSATTTINLIAQPSNNQDDWINAAEVFAYEDGSGNQVEDQEIDGALDIINGNDAGDDDYSTSEIRIYDLALTKELLTAPPYKYFDTLTFRLTVYNQGNETTGEVIVTDYITEGYEFVPSANTALGWAGSAPTPFAALNNIAPQTNEFIDIKLVLLPNMFDAGAWDNYAEIFQIKDSSGAVVNADEADSTPNSNSIEENSVLPGSSDDNNIDGNGPAFGEDEDDHDPATTRVLDLALIKDRGTAVPSYSYTQNVEFTITVENQGNTAVNQLSIIDTLSCGYSFDGGINPGWVYDASINSVRFIDNSPPAPSSLKTYSLILNVDPCYDGFPLDNWDNATEIESVVASDGLGNDDIDGSFDNNFSNDPPTMIYSSDDNNLEGLGPDQNEDEDNHDVERADVYDLALKNEIITPEPYNYGDILDFRIRVYNQGNIVADSIDFRSHIPDGYEYLPTENASAGWTIVDPSTVNILYNQFLFPGDSVDLILKLRVLESNGKRDWINRTYVFIPRDTFGLNRGDDADSFPFGENSGEIAVDPGSPEDNDLRADGPPDNDEDEDDHDVAGFFLADMSLEKSIPAIQSEYEVGDPVDFEITINNDGGQNVTNYMVVDYIPCGFSFNPIGNDGWSLNVGTGYLEYTDNDGLDAGLSETIPLTLTVEDCGNMDPENWLNKAEIAEFTDEDGGMVDFDSTPDQIPDNDPPTEDDYDEIGINVALANAEIGDFVWEDLDGDGFQDNNEPGIPGVTVVLFNDSDIEIASTTTDNNGFYSFSALEAGNYYVFFDVSTDFDPTVPDATSEPTDSDVTGANGPNTTDIFTLTSNEINNDVDAGYFVCVTICGTAWYDINKDDMFDDFENGINGLKVRIYKLVGGQYIYWDLTTTGHKPNTPSDDGYFEFCTSPGTYYIEIVMPPLGLVQVRPNIGPPNKSSDLTNAFGKGTTNSFTISSSNPNCDILGGFYPMATMGNLVWYDDNNNGIQDNGEVPAQNIQVDLYDENSNIIETTNTNANGVYEFEYLEKKEYFIGITPPPGYNFTLEHNGDENLDSDVDHSNGLNTTARFMMEPGVDAVHVDGGLSNSVLPVDWLDVHAVYADNQVRLTWDVANEVNMSHYSIERLIGTTDRFLPIDQKKATGDRSYNIIDNDIIQNGLYQYRIKQIDLDGTYSYSKTVSVQIEDDFRIRVYPNPTSDYVQLELGKEGQYQVEFYDNNGLLVYFKMINDDRSSINIQNFAPGKYNLRILKNGLVVDEQSIIKIN